MSAPRPSGAVKDSSTSPTNGTVGEERWPVASGANPGSALRSLAALLDGPIAVAAGPPSPEWEARGSRHEDPFSPVVSGSSSAILTPALGFDGLVAFAGFGRMMRTPTEVEEENLGETESEDATEQATHHQGGAAGAGSAT